MRIRSPLILASLIVATPALADCPDQKLVFQPASGKLGFRMEIMPAELGAKALVHRPFRSTPDTYEIVAERSSETGSRYVLVGPAGTLRFDVDANGTAVVEANREIPSRWRLACQERPAPE
jgi:hypothetical protein